MDQWSVSNMWLYYIRGIPLSKEKKYWCPRCQTEKEGKKILTVKKVVRKISDDETQKIFFICSECKREFEIRQLRGIVWFLNQVTIVLSIGHVIINMMFKDCFKLTGNKAYDDVVEAIISCGKITSIQFRMLGP